MAPTKITEWDVYQQNTSSDTSRQKRWQQAVVQAAATLESNTQYQPRLQAAMDFALTDAAKLRDAGIAMVKSSAQNYQVAPEQGCSCKDAQESRIFL